MRFVKSGFAIGLVAIALIVAYQNCAPNTSNQVNQAGSAAEEVEIDFPVQAMKARGSCEFEELNCLRKVYSPAVEDLQTDEVLCLDENLAQNCLKVRSIYYNTSYALENCFDCTAEDAKQGGQYNREEVTCWVGAPAAGEDSVFALRSGFAEAAQAALAVCRGGQ